MLISKYRLSEEQVRAMDHKMEQTAAAEGLEYHLTRAGTHGQHARRASTGASGGESRSSRTQMLERLYKAYFTEQRSIFDLESLVALAVEDGLDATEVREALESDRLRRRGDARPEGGPVTRGDRRPVLRDRRPLRHLGRAGDRRLQSRARDGRRGLRTAS